MRNVDFGEGIYEEFDMTPERSQYYKTNNSTMFNVTWVNIKSALISAFVTAVLGMAGYVIGVGDVFKLDGHALINVGALSALTAIVSILKAFFTTEKGEFLGVVKVHPAE